MAELLTEERFEEIMNEERPRISWQEREKLPRIDETWEGMLIMKKYIGTKDVIGAAEHDEIFGPNIDDLIKGGITEEDVRKLHEYGWSMDEWKTGMHHFV